MCYFCIKNKPTLLPCPLSLSPPSCAPTQSKVEGDPDLARKLHSEGERGLRIFGYEPERSLRVSGGYQCGTEHDATCPKPPSAQSRSTSPRQSVQRKNTQVGAVLQIVQKKTPTWGRFLLIGLCMFDDRLRGKVTREGGYMIGR